MSQILAVFSPPAVTNCRPDALKAMVDTKPRWVTVCVLPFSRSKMRTESSPDEIAKCFPSGLKQRSTLNTVGYWTAGTTGCVWLACQSQTRTDLFGSLEVTIARYLPFSLKAILLTVSPGCFRVTGSVAFLAAHIRTSPFVADAR